MAGGGIGGRRLLDLLEPGWRRELAAGTRAADLGAPPDLTAAASAALGTQARESSAEAVAGRWPACVIVSLAAAAAHVHADTGRRQPRAADAGSFWPEWYRRAGLRGGRRSAGAWGAAFLAALGALGLPAAGTSAADAIRAQASASGEEGEEADTEQEPAGLRLDPFGGGVLRTDAVLGEACPVPPEEALPKDPGNPEAGGLLAFDADGALVAGELPAEAVWVMFPADAGLSSDVPLRTLMTSTLPLSWHGWQLAQVDLSGASWLAARTTEGAGTPEGARTPDGPGTRRPVRGRSAPVLRTGPPVPGVTTLGGRPVYAAPPEVLLPPGQGNWRIEVRRAATGAVIASAVIAAARTTGTEWRPADLWRSAPRPLLGDLVITVTAGAGTATRGLRRTVALAEGLSVGSFPFPRLTRPRGLQTAEAVISVPSGMTVSPAAALYGETIVAREVTCVAGPVTARLAITPPHIRLRIDPEPGSGGTATPWHYHGPLPLAEKDLWRGGALRIDLPGKTALPAISVARNGESLQTFAPTGDGRYPLRRILDTVTAHGDVDLVIDDSGDPVTIVTVTGTGTRNDPWAVT